MGQSPCGRCPWLTQTLTQLTPTDGQAAETYPPHIERRDPTTLVATTAAQNLEHQPEPLGLLAILWANRWWVLCQKNLHQLSLASALPSALASAQHLASLGIVV